MQGEDILFPVRQLALSMLPSPSSRLSRPVSWTPTIPTAAQIPRDYLQSPYNTECPPRGFLRAASVIKAPVAPQSDPDSISDAESVPDEDGVGLGESRESASRRLLIMVLALLEDGATECAFLVGG